MRDNSKAAGARPEAIRAVIFDMDGVLVDSESFGFEALRRVMTRYSLPYSEEENAEFLGRTTLDSCRILKARYGFEASAETLADWYVEHMLEQIGRGPIPMTGVPEVLRQVRASGYRMALASSAEVRVIEANLQKLRLTGAVVRCRDALGALREDRAAGASYDLLLVDPPYAEYASSLQMELSDLLSAVLAPAGLVVLETSAKIDPALDLELVTSRRYGSARLTLYRPPVP